MRLLFVVCASVAVTSCATTPQQASAPPPAPITCQAGADCDAKWSRAVSWVANNSAYKVQTQTDSMMQTMGPLPDDPAPAFSITKVAQTNGTYEITFRGGCDNVIGCIPTVAESRASFADFVMGSTTASATMVWARKDHRRASGNPVLEKQMQSDREKCQADASKNGQPGNPAFENTYKACMGARGYVLESLEQATREAR